MISGTERFELIEMLNNKLEYLYTDMYGYGDLGAQEVFNYNKCVTAGEIKETFTFIKSFNRNLKRLNKMIEMDDSRDIELLKEVKQLFLKLHERGIDSNTYNIRIPYKIYNSIMKTIYEFERYDGFCENQNSFDNMISIIKIHERLSRYNNALKLNGEFDSEDKLHLDIVKDLKSQMFRQLESIRFRI